MKKNARKKDRKKEEVRMQERNKQKTNKQTNKKRKKLKKVLFYTFGPLRLFVGQASVSSDAVLLGLNCPPRSFVDTEKMYVTGGSEGELLLLLLL